MPTDTYGAMLWVHTVVNRSLGQPCCSSRVLKVAASLSGRRREVSGEIPGFDRPGLRNIRCDSIAGDLGRQLPGEADQSGLRRHITDGGLSPARRVTVLCGCHNDRSDVDDTASPARDHAGHTFWQSRNGMVRLVQVCSFYSSRSDPTVSAISVNPRHCGQNISGV